MHSTYLRHITSSRLPLPVLLPMSRFGMGWGLGGGTIVGMLRTGGIVGDFLEEGCCSFKVTAVIRHSG